MLKALVENLCKIFRLPSTKSVAFSVTHALVHFVQTENKVSRDKRNGEITSKTLTSKGDVTRHDSQRRFLAQHSVAILL